jgi:hypothetical protein
MRLLRRNSMAALELHVPAGGGEGSDGGEGGTAADGTASRPGTTGGADEDKDVVGTRCGARWGPLSPHARP